MPQILYCWRCNAKVLMMTNEERAEFHSRLNMGTIPRPLLQTREAAFNYAKETLLDPNIDWNTIWHHMTSLYGPPCEYCQRPLRTPKASLCANCWKPRKPRPPVSNEAKEDTHVQNTSTATNVTNSSNTPYTDISDTLSNHETDDESNQDRKLASIQKVESVEPIEGADNIVKIKVLGWTLIALKGEFKPNDLCVFFEIDALLPDLPYFQFVRRGRTSPSSLRVKTLKLRGVVSQGLAMPLDLLKQMGVNGNWYPDSVGYDLTKMLHVRHYDVILRQSNGANRGLGHAARRPFPSYLRKTDEVRAQSNPKLIQALLGQPYYISLKLDGTSATYADGPKGFVACSRNFELKPNETKTVFQQKWESFKDFVFIKVLKSQPYIDRKHLEKSRIKGEAVWWKVAKNYDLANKLKGTRICIQGEIVGPNIQGNKSEFPHEHFFVFNVVNINTKKNLSLKESLDFCKAKGLEFVPILEQGENFQYDLDKLLQLAEGKYPNTKNEREGIVVRPIREAHSDELGKGLSFKVISNKFLLNEKD